MGALAGIACGFVGALPLVLLMRREAQRLGHGIAAVAFAFALIQLGMLAVHLWWHEELLAFGALAVTSYLLAVVASVVRREWHP